jgi:hypothetical protein
MFLDDTARDLCLDWPETARENVGILHLYASYHPHGPRLTELVRDLSADPGFRR